MIDPKIINSDELLELLINPPVEAIKKSNHYSTIELIGYVIDGNEYLSINGDGFEIESKIEFKNCKFNKFTFIENIICNADVLFESCSFSKGIYFKENVNFREDLTFKYGQLESIHLSNGSFNKISISVHESKMIWISGAKFNDLHIGEFLHGDNINELIVFAKENETGNIYVHNQEIEKISLYGTNKSNEFNFSNIKCNNVSIDKFKNEGILNFYGLTPKHETIEAAYFQIVNSNLNNAQFFRIDFTLYKELIIIDSFITDCLFISCKWGQNVRALLGPGYGSFEESIENGRKISSKEVFAIREAYRQLKVSMSKHSDKIQESKFYAGELTFHNLTLAWGSPFENQFWDKLILFWSKIFSDYGQSFVRPLFWLLFGHLGLFILAIFLNGFSTLRIEFCNPTSEAFKEAFEKYFIYINPLRRLEVSLTGYLIVLDLLMRVWSSYMVYNLIRASRRFIS